ncbi:39S ribosomal protein L52, mitochondrial isoform X2 [Pteropus alecto]|uniref:Large ribosomal subunit protein mL52 n=2 Tax=Pteropus vampyrus TaxID=132908 RepID=A0A6P3QVF4_PTEVA|nr:39S ribosomal protein L52, mitochondrial isoform X2 [Pteropus alecto]XP_011371071.1 39S ribosomal protein L52, mitochondrial isoform X2 [Pteropus vampyrus]
MSHAHFRPLGISMAALGTLLSSIRRLHCSAAIRAGSQWRLQQGLAASPSGYGPLTELPDWSYADGRPAPPMKGQLRRKAQREKFARRVVLLSQEMDAGLQAWQLRQQEKLQEEERKQKNALKPKGAVLQTSLPSQ